MTSKRKTRNKKIILSVVTIVAILVIIVAALGITGLVSVPGFAPKINVYSPAMELDASTVEPYFSLMQGVPTPTELKSYGLSVHIYGTDDCSCTVLPFYRLQLVGWNTAYEMNGTGYSFTVWRNIAYGFGLSVDSGAAIRQVTGYKTLFMTVEGPGASWVQLLLKYGAD